MQPRIGIQDEEADDENYADQPALPLVVPHPERINEEVDLPAELPADENNPIIAPN